MKKTVRAARASPLRKACRSPVALCGGYQSTTGRDPSPHFGVLPKMRGVFSKRAGGSRPHGFSLLEVMIAVAILAISFLALINFQGQTMFRLSRAEKITQATFLADEKIGEVILQIEKEYAQQRVFPEDKSDSGTFEKPYEPFSWEWQLRKVEIPAPGGEEGGPMAGMMNMVTAQLKDLVREIKVTVKWEELGKERKIDVVTHMAKL